MSNSNQFALPASLLARFVELADQTHWDGAIASGWTPAEIVDMVLGHVDKPLTIDDYESFVGCPAMSRGGGADARPPARAEPVGTW